MNTRRDFLLRSGALTAGALASRLAPLGALGLSAAAHAQAAGDYKALVCVFLYGGVPGNHLVIPIDNAGYPQYVAVRTIASRAHPTHPDPPAIPPPNLGTPYP